MKRLTFALAFLLVFAEQAIAQQVVQSGMGGGSWKQLVAVILNTAGVVLVVQLLKFFLPILKERYPWALPIIATLVGPGVAYLQITVAGWAGVDVDFTPVVAALTGGMAVAAHQVKAQTKEVPQ